MKETLLSLLGVVVGAIITYIFNLYAEKKSLKNKVYIEIYEQIIKNIDKTSKSSKDIKTLKISQVLEKQYKNPNNYGDVHESLDNTVKDIFKTMQIKTNDLVDLNLYFNYHMIPLEEHQKDIKWIEHKSFQIIDSIKELELLYKSTVSTIGLIRIDNIVWEKIMKEENLIEKYVNEYLNKNMIFSNNIQENYYKDLLKIKSKRNKEV